MLKKLIVVLLATCLTFLVGIKVFAADTTVVDLGSNQEVSSINGFSGYIDTYRSDYFNTDTYQTQDNLQLNLDYGYHERGRRHHHERPDHYRPFGPRLWVYTVIGILVVDLLIGEDFE